MDTDEHGTAKWRWLGWPPIDARRRIRTSSPRSRTKTNRYSNALVSLTPALSPRRGRALPAFLDLPFRWFQSPAFLPPLPGGEGGVAAVISRAEPLVPRRPRSTNFPHRPRRRPRSRPRKESPWFTASTYVHCWMSGLPMNRGPAGAPGGTSRPVPMQSGSARAWFGFGLEVGRPLGACHAGDRVYPPINRWAIVDRPSGTWMGSWPQLASIVGRPASPATSATLGANPKEIRTGRRSMPFTCVDLCPSVVLLRFHERP
jgi:hypothetical protein